MMAPFAQSDIPINIIKQAANWLVKSQERKLTPIEQQALLNWRKADPLNELAWKRAEKLGLTMRQIPPEIGLQVLGRPASLDRRKFTKHIVLLLTLAPAGMMAYQYAPWESAMAEFKTAKGKQSKYQLADGSQIMLNTNSAADVEFNQHHRLIKLYQGEIFIATAKDQLQRPFLIQTVDGQLHALGTKFVVRKESEETYLGVIENAVDVFPKNNPNQHKVIHAGQQTVFNANTINPNTMLDNNADAWVDGIIYADNMPLPTFIQMLMRYRTGVIQCDDSCKEISISGVFQLDDTERILQVLEETRPIQVEWRTRYWARLTKKESAVEEK